MIRLQQLRLDAHLTPEQLAAATGVAAATIRRLESGHGGQVATLGRLADHFGVRASELLRPAIFDAGEPVGGEAA